MLLPNENQDPVTPRCLSNWSTAATDPNRSDSSAVIDLNFSQFRRNGEKLKVPVFRISIRSDDSVRPGKAL